MLIHLRDSAHRSAVRSRCARLVVPVLLVGLALLSANCSNPINPEAGLPLPKDPGTVVVRVFGPTSQPLANVRVSVTQPNTIGGMFKVSSYTDASGTQTFPGIPAGSRPVSVEPPAGYGPGADGLVKISDVVRNQTVTVTFTLAAVAQ